MAMAEDRIGLRRWRDEWRALPPPERRAIRDYVKAAQAPEDARHLRVASRYAVHRQRLSLGLALALPVAYWAFALLSYLADGLSLLPAFQALVKDIQAWIIGIALLSVELFSFNQARKSRKAIDSRLR